MLYIQYTDNNKTLAASIATGVTPEQAAEVMGLKDGDWKEITEAEYLELQKLTSEELQLIEAQTAQAEASAILTARAQRQLVQTEDFSAPEYALFAAAGLFPAWTPGTTYAPGARLVYEGIVYETRQPVTAQGHQPPGGEGMLAVYRPLSVDAETGHEPDGGPENPYPWRGGMDVYTGKYYTYEGRLYLAKADMLPCIWAPGTPGLWQWEPAG